MKRNTLTLSLLLAVTLVIGTPSLATDKSKTVSLKGKVSRSDTKELIANASVMLLDEKKSDKQDNSVVTKTDEQGNFVFEKVVAGKYTVSISAWYKAQEDAPCQVLLGKTTDKDSTVIVDREEGKDGFVQHVFIKGFSIKAGKDIVRDFDFACKSMFGS